MPRNPRKFQCPQCGERIAGKAKFRCRTCGYVLDMAWISYQGATR